MGRSRGNSGATDPFSYGGHPTRSDGAAINAAVWELSDHGKRAASAREIAEHAALGAGWPRVNRHLDCWHNAGALKGCLPSGRRFRPDRVGQSEEAQWVLDEIPLNSLIRRPSYREEVPPDDLPIADAQTRFIEPAFQAVEMQPSDAFPPLPEHIMREITAMYGDLAKLYSELEPEMQGQAIGARILISPPRVGADVMFVAYQPADSSGFPQERACDPRWPEENEYATRDWKLATAVRSLGVSPAVLQGRTIVTNVIFWRAKNKKAWNKVPKEPRNKAAAFSLKRVGRLIELLKPKAIIAIGFDVFKALKPTNTEDKHQRRASNGRIDRVVSIGEVAGCPIIGTLHLSGAQMNNADRDVIATYVQALLAD